MTTPPAGVFKKIYPPNGGLYLAITGPTDWANFCDLGTATAMAEGINGANLGITMNLTPYIDYEETLGYYISNPSGPRMYAIQGMMQDGTPIYADPVGSFADRQANPNPFLDRNPDTSLGGGAAGAAGAKIMLRNMGSAGSPVWCLYWGSGTPWPLPQ
jgi:hypothetical protein